MTLNRERVTLPIEVYLRIVHMVEISDFLSLSLVSVFVHDVVASVLYHDVQLDQDNAVRRLAGLTLYLERGVDNHERTPPAYCIRTLSYYSCSARIDNEALPKLCKLLESAWHLRYLSMDVHHTSVSLAVKLFQTSGIERSEPCPVLTMWHMDQGIHNSCRYAIPQLQGVSSSSVRLMQPLVQFRMLRAINMDGVTPGDMFGLVGHMRKSCLGLRVESFTCEVNFESFVPHMDEIVRAFPRLQYLCLALDCLRDFPAVPVSRLHRVSMYVLIMR